MKKNNITINKIFLETSFLEFPTSGIRNYLSTYLKVSQNYEKVEHINCTIVYNYYKLSIVNKLAKNNRLIRIIRDYFYRLLLLQFFLLKERSFILISPYHNLYLPLSKKRYIITIHDLVFIEKPEYFTGLTYYINRYLLSWSLKNNLAIITISLDTKNRIRKYCKPDQEIHLIYNSYPSSFQSWSKEIQIEDNPPYLFYFGGVDPRKNLSLMFEIFKTYKENLGGELNLVCTKTKESYQNLIGENEIPQGTYFVGDLSSNELITKLSGCTGVVYLSGYEGFGRPIMEGAAFQKPIIVMNLDVYQEIPGAKLYVVKNKDSGIKALEKLEKFQKEQRPSKPILNPLYISQNNEVAFEKLLKHYLQINE